MVRRREERQVKEGRRGGEVKINAKVVELLTQEHTSRQYF